MKNKIIDGQLNDLYYGVDKFFRMGWFDEINFELEELDIQITNTDILLGWLTVTLPAKSKLPFRKEFFNKVVLEIEKRGEMEPNLLRGLE
jgi:hypothetical protein